MKVAAVILTYNRAEAFAKALRSAIEQSHHPALIYISDCSSDAYARNENKEIAAQICESKILYVPRDKPIPQGDHLQLVLSELSGMPDLDLVALLDDDDVWMPEHLQRSIDQFTARENIGLTVSNRLEIDPHDTVIGKQYDDSNQLPSTRLGWLDLYLRSMYGSTSGFIFRHALINVINFYSRPNVDQFIAIHTLLNKWQIHAFLEPSFYYLVHQSNYGRGEIATRMLHYNRLLLATNKLHKLIFQYPKFLALLVKSLLYLLKNGGLRPKEWARTR